MPNNEMNENLILKVKNLKKYFPIESGFFQRTSGYIRAIDNINFNVKNGETFGLVGESGCGKTTTARCIIRAFDPTEGKILFRTSEDIVDMATIKKGKLKEVRKNIQMIFQDPNSSLNPRMRILDIIAEPMTAHGYSKTECRERVKELLELVGLDANYLDRYPHAFSGGQRQRIGIARALSINPSFICADEPVSALDVSVQAQLLNLLLDLQDQFNLTFLFIAHDLSVIRIICDRVAVMYLGNIVEIAETGELFNNPIHPYTKGLMSAIPDPDPRKDWLVEENIIKGELSDPTEKQKGCRFASRCPKVKKICRNSIPSLEKISGKEEHKVACHFLGEMGVEENVS